MGYRSILLKAGKQVQVDEETIQAKHTIASDEALDRVVRAEALKAAKMVKTQQDKMDWIIKKYGILFKFFFPRCCFQLFSLIVYFEGTRITKGKRRSKFQ